MMMLSSSRAAAGRCRCDPSRQRRLCRRFLSSNDSESSSNAQQVAPTSDLGHPQPFVNTVLEPGEWDPAQTDPLYRPVWRNKTRIISKEDFANRPKVGLSAEFANFHDAMVTTSWMKDSDQKHLYQVYLEITSHMQGIYSLTSHEYVIQVLAQRFNITAIRAAAIVQLQHNEARYRLDGSRPLEDELQEAFDQEAESTLRDAYSVYGMPVPTSFVETPVGIAGLARDDKAYQVVEDEFNVDDLVTNADARDATKARNMIENHIYEEDRDDATVAVPLDKDCQQLIAAQKTLTLQSKESSSNNVDNNNNTEKKEANRRPRWKFVAQTVNTRMLKKQQKKGGTKKQQRKVISHSYTNNSVANTLVEQDGTLRAATLEDVLQTSWKPVQTPLERIYRGAKRAWLDYSVRDDSKAWGKGGADEATTDINVQRFLSEGPDYREKDKAEAAGVDDDKGIKEEAVDASGESGSDDKDEVERTDDDDDKPAADATTDSDDKRDS